MIDLPVYKIVFDGQSEMIVNSLVDVPAHLRYFIAQNGKKRPLAFAVNDEKREITGVVISANQPIYYYSEQIPECYMVFEPATIKQIMLSYFASNKANLIDVQHDFHIKEGAVTMIESYLTDDNKKSPFDVEAGSWIITYKVNDNELWQQIKEGKINGFSIAGNFHLEKLNFNNKLKNQTIMKTLKEKIMALFEAEIKMKDVKTVDGKKMRAAEDLVEGAKLYAIADDGTEVLAPQGEYMFDVDGKTVKVTVNELGVIVAVEDVVQQAAPDYAKEIADLKNEIASLRKEIEESMTAIATEMSKKIKFHAPKKEEAGKKNEIKVRV